MASNPAKKHFKVISILVDNDSWILPYAQQLLDELSTHYQCQLLRHAKDIPQGDVCFLLGCVHLLAKDILARNQYNLVVHESDLPKGKGFAPMAWQILGKQNSIPVCLIEADESADSGKIWLQDTITLTGDELHDEWRAKQGEISVKMALDFIENFSTLSAKQQQGQESYYPKRTPKDSELDIHRSIAEQFDLLRVVSNQDYPAFFIKDGVKYKLEIYRDEQ